MKKIAIIVAAVFASVNMFAQGTVNFSNLGLAGAGVIDPTTGKAAAKGTTFMAELYFAPDGTTDPSLFQEANHDGNGNTVGPVALGPLDGLYSGGTRKVDITPPGFFAMFQVRVWEASFGSSYDAAIAAGTNPALGRAALVGVSQILRVDTGDPTTVPPGTPGSLKGISGITLSVVPEPSVIGLGLLGAGALLLLRRRK